MKKNPASTLILSGIIILLGAILFTPTYNLIRGVPIIANRSGQDGAPVEEQDSAVYAQGELVSDFPDMPVYPGAIVEKSTEINDGDQYGYIGTWKIENKTSTEVLRFYLTEGKKRNWTIVHSPDLSPNSSNEYIEARINGKKAYIIVEKESDDKEVEVRVDFPPEN